MVIVSKTKKGNTKIVASYPYCRGNIRDRFYFRGTALFEKLSKMEGVSIRRDLPDYRTAFRTCLDR